MRSFELKKSLDICLEQVDIRFEFTFERLRFLLMQHQAELSLGEIHTILDLFILLLQRGTIKNECTWKHMSMRSKSTPHAQT